MTLSALSAASPLLKGYSYTMEEEKSLTTVKKKDNFNLTEDLQPKIRRKLLNIAIETYEDIMVDGTKAADRKAAADAVMELLGKKNKNTQATANFNFNIPPEYFKKVFGEGLGKITNAEAPMRLVVEGNDVVED